jgi:hypothetical protein
MLEDIGFRMIDVYHYWWYGCPMIFIYAVKPEPNPPIKSILEKDVALGVFTNKTAFLPALWASVYKQFPQIPFITRIQRGMINEGMRLLREDFLKSKIRYWVFLDDDIVFLHPDTIKNALEYMIAEKFACMSVFSTFEPSALGEPYNPNKLGLEKRETRWATGYFICVDSWKVGHILPDMNLPDGNTSVDTSYSVSIVANGYNIGISPDYVYHVKKQVWAKPDIIDITNKYLMNKWGEFYYSIAKYDYNVIDEHWRREGCLIR